MDIIRIAKKTLFPNGYLAPPPIDPTPEEQVVIRERLAARIQEVIPGRSNSRRPIYSSFRTGESRSLTTGYQGGLLRWF